MIHLIINLTEIVLVKRDHHKLDHGFKKFFNLAITFMNAFVLPHQHSEHYFRVHTFTFRSTEEEGCTHDPELCRCHMPLFVIRIVTIFQLIVSVTGQMINEHFKFITRKADL